MSYEYQAEIGDAAGRQAIITLWKETKESLIPKGKLERAPHDDDVVNKIDWYIRDFSTNQIIAFVQTRVGMSGRYGDLSIPVRVGYYAKLKSEEDVFLSYTGAIPQYFVFAEYYKKTDSGNYLFDKLNFLDCAEIKQYSGKQRAKLPLKRLYNGEDARYTMSYFAGYPATKVIR